MAQLHLDVQRPVIWDIGAIALSGHPKAHNLIVDIMLASTAIPAFFRLFILRLSVRANFYDELHVDGGVTTQVYDSFAFDLDETLKKIGLEGPVSIYLIRNAQIHADIKAVPPKTLPIVTHSFSTLMRYQSLSDMYRIYQDARINNMSYNVAYIPSSFSETPEENFDVKYMKKLFQYASDKAEAGYPWQKTPPDGDSQ